MNNVTRWFVCEELERNPNLTKNDLKRKFPKADDEEIEEGIEEFKKGLKWGE